MPRYASPNTMSNEYFRILERLVYGLGSLEDEAAVRQQVALSIFQAVTTVETFLNLYFRLIVSEKEFHKHEPYFLKTIQNRKSLDFKLKDWPRTILEKELNLGSGVGKEFTELKNLRNSLMHFTSSHDSVDIPGAQVQGMVNIEIYERLKKEDAENVLELAYGFISEVFRLRGVKESDIPHTLSLWSGKPPMQL